MHTVRAWFLPLECSPTLPSQLVGTLTNDEALSAEEQQIFDLLRHATSGNPDLHGLRASIGVAFAGLSRSLWSSLDSLTNCV